jgi:hypothetical protein
MPAAGLSVNLCAKQYENHNAKLGATTDQPKNGSYLFLSNALPQDMILDFKKNETSAIESSKKPNSEKLIIKTKKE